MSLLLIVALVGAILVAWFLGALLVGLAVGRILSAHKRGTLPGMRGEFDRAA